MISIRDQHSFLGRAKPPGGYRLTYCLGTTFSLDLECLLQLALNSSRIESSLQDTNELESFAALQDFQAKAVVFCQSCRIKESHFLLEEARGSTGVRRLLATLDSSVIPVPAPALKAAFHPKVWLFRYDGDQGKAPPVFNLWVQSRNLTASRDWDITVLFNGSLSKTKNATNRPLSEFFNQLHGQTRRPQKQKLIQFAIRDLQQIHFESIPDFSDRWEFLFQWPNRKKWTLLNPDHYRELIAVSPFLGQSVTTLTALQSIPKFTLITGPKHIATVKQVEGLDKNTFVMASTPEGAWDTTDAGPDQLGLHAKMYIGLHKRSDAVDILIGSANLTDAAFRGKNCEAMLRLRGHLRHYRNFETEFIYKDHKKKILQPWLQSLESLISTQGEMDTEKDPSKETLELLRSQIAQGSFYLRFPKRSQQAILRFTCEAPIRMPSDVRAEFRLAGASEISPLEHALAGGQQVFRAPPDERTEFVAIRLTHDTHELRFVTIASSDLDRSARSTRTLNHLVKDADSFFRLLGLMLGTQIPRPPSRTPPPEGPEKPKARSRRKHARLSNAGSAFLEPLLLSGHLDIEREDEIEKTIKAFLKARHPASQKALVSQFSKIWTQYRKASDTLRRRG